MNRVVLISLLIGLAGCAGPKLYLQDDLAKTTAMVYVPGTIESNFYFFPVYTSEKTIRLDSVDSKRHPSEGRYWVGSEWDGSSCLELLPGKHTLTLSGTRERTTIGYPMGMSFYKHCDEKTIEFSVEAGKAYEVAAKIFKGNSDCEFRVIESTSTKPKCP
jgi:hypothetical protein